MFEKKDEKKPEGGGKPPANDPAKELEASQARVAELEKDLAGKTEELKKLKNKDFNFRRLEEMTQEERDRLTEEEVELKKGQEKLMGDIAEHRKAVQDDWMEAALGRVDRGDPERRAKIMKEMEGLKTDLGSRKGVEEAVRRAAKLAFEEPVDHIGGAFQMNGAAPEGQAKKERFSETEAGKALGSRLGIEDNSGKK